MTTTESKEEIKEEPVVPFEAIAVIGQLIKIGGTDDSVHFTLKDLHTDVKHSGEIDIEKAKKLSKHLFEGEVEVSGIGQWVETERGYKLTKFKAETFVSLLGLSNSEVFGLLRDASGDWKKSENPVKDAIRVVSYE